MVRWNELEDMMLHHRPRLISLVGCVLALLYLGVNPANLSAQTVSGTILGQIQDQQGAAIGKTEIAARNLETGAVRRTNAENNGENRFSRVPAGSYEVTASIAGFKLEMRSGIEVTVGGDVEVNFFFNDTADTEKVEVTA